MRGARWGRIGEWAAIVSGTVAGAVWATWPLARRLGEVLPGEDRDPLLNAWILAWTAERARHGFRGLWNAPILYPYRNTFAFSEHLLGLAPVSVPLEWITANPIATYNLLFLASYVLAAAGMYLLVLELTGRRDAALVAAAAFAFCPYRVAQVARVQIEMCGWIAVTMWALHRYIRTRRNLDLAMAVAAFTIQALTNGYYLYYALLPVAVVGAAAWRDDRLDTRTLLRAAAVGTAVIAICVAPIARIYIDVRRDYDLKRDLADNSRFSADVGSYLHVTPSIRAAFAPARWLPDFTKPDGPLETKEGELFPGLAPLVLAIAALFVYRRSSREDHAGLRDRSWYRLAWRRDVPLAAAAYAVFAVLIGWDDPGTSFAVWILLIRSVLPLPRTDAGLYAVIGVWAVVLSLGPEPTAWGHPFFPGSPYSVLFRIVPGLDGLRVPARAGVITSFALAVVAGLVVARINRPELRRTVTVGAIVLVFADCAVAIPDVEIGPHGRLQTDAVYRWIGAQPPGAVLELPIGRMDYNYSGFRYEYATLTHGHPLVNGWTGYSTPLQQFLGTGASPLRDLAHFDAALDMLDGLGVRYIVVHPGDFEEPALPTALLEAFRARPRRATESARVGDVVAFQLHPPSSTVAVAVGGGTRGDIGQAVLSVKPARASASDQGGSISAAMDGDLNTRWASASPQRGTEWVDLTLDAPGSVCGLELDVNPRSLLSYPRRVDISDAEGTVLYDGPILFQLGEAFRRDPGRLRVWIVWPAVSTAHLHVRQTGVSSTDWAIDELRVLAGAGCTK